LGSNSSVPSPIFIAALLTTERLRIVHLPEEINSLVESKRNQVIRKAIQKHYVDTSGRVPAFGRIEGYYFVRFAGFSDLDFGIPFNLDGSPVGDMVAIRRVPEAGLGMKHRDTRLTGLLKNEPDGVTEAKLLTEAEPRGIRPNISVPVRARPQQ
jgi:hypothetical protein